MRTTKPISAQILVDYTYHKNSSVPFGLVCVRNSFTLARKLYEESRDYKVFDERPDYRFIALKDRYHGGFFYDVLIPGQIHGLIQALNEGELRKMFQRLKLLKYHVLEFSDEILSINKTELRFVEVSKIRYNSEQHVWHTYGYGTIAIENGQEFQGHVGNRAPFFYCWSPNGLQEIF